MIKIVFKKQDGAYKSVKITGHALSGDPGYDLICAAVSAISTGALNGFDTLINDVIVTMDESPTIFIQTNQITQQSELLFKFLFIQLKTVEEIAKSYMKITEKEDKS